MYVCLFLFLENVFWVCPKHQVCNTKNETDADLYAEFIGRDVQSERNDHIPTCIYLHPPTCYSPKKCYHCKEKGELLPCFETTLE